jgi:hypothetical protein
MLECKYPIKYIDSTHLFWKRYPYKVALSLPRDFVWKQSPLVDWFHNMEQLQRVRRSYSRKYAPFCPDDLSMWRMSTCTRSINFFFVHEGDTSHFIDAAHSVIRNVHRPVTDDVLAVMRTDSSAIVRKHLFWGQYRWCVTFRALTEDQQSEIQTWTTKALINTRVDGVLGDRHSWSIGDVVRLYLADDNDVLVIKLGYASRISRIDRVILTSEID